MIGYKENKMEGEELELWGYRINCNIRLRWNQKDWGMCEIIGEEKSLKLKKNIKIKI